MIEISQAGAFLVAVAVLIVVPGPSVVFLISRALAYGWRTGLATVIGNSAGLLAIVLLVSLGLGPVVQKSETVLFALKIVGGLYLMWLGVQAVRARKEFEVLPGSSTNQIGSQRGWPSIRDGFVVGFSNPKGFVIFGAILPPFVDPGLGHAGMQMFELGVIAFAVGMICDMVWVLLASQLRAWFATSPHRGRMLGGTGGALMMVLGLGVIAGWPND